MVDRDGRSGLLRDAAYEELRRKIVCLEIPPGASYNETDLADLIGVTKFAIRSAIQRLRTERLLHVVPRGRTVIAPIDLYEVQQAYEVRTHLEILCARLAAQRGTDDEMELLQENVCQLQQAIDERDGVGTIERTRAFYVTLAAASHNPILVDEHRVVLSLTERWEHFRAHGRAGPEKGPALLLCDAVVRRDADAAARVIDQDVRQLRRKAITEVLEQSWPGAAAAAGQFTMSLPTAVR